MEHIKSKGKAILKNTNVTLSTCQGCAGCITSSEPVLYSFQKIDDFIENTKRKKVVVMVISLQSRASVALKLQTSELAIQKILSKYLKAYYGVKYTILALILDISSISRLAYKSRSVCSWKTSKTSTPQSP